MPGLVPGSENLRLRPVRFDFTSCGVFQTVNLPGDDGDDGGDGDARKIWHTPRDALFPPVQEAKLSFVPPPLCEVFAVSPLEPLFRWLQRHVRGTRSSLP